MLAGQRFAREEYEMTEASLITYIAALFSMTNPIGNVGIFAGMTADRSAGEAKLTAWTCAFAVAVTLLIMTWSGGLLLKFFGIDIHELRAAGGIIVLLIGLSMLRSDTRHQQTSAEAEDDKEREQIAIVPMAIPIVAGPGAMATAILAAGHHGSFASKVELSFAVIALAGLIGLLFSFSRPIANVLGTSGMGVVTRVMGMILAAIAMGMLADGLKGMLPGLA